VFLSRCDFLPFALRVHPTRARRGPDPERFSRLSPDGARLRVCCSQIAENLVASGALVVLKIFEQDSAEASQSVVLTCGQPKSLVFIPCQTPTLSAQIKVSSKQRFGIRPGHGDPAGSQLLFVSKNVVGAHGVIIFEFPDVETLNTWYNAPEYQPLIALRQSAVDMSKDMMIAVDAA
jgi:hypothetical protein